MTDSIFYLLAGLVLLLQVGDVLTTNRILARRGGRELNPLMRWFIRRLGRWWWVSKAPVLALLFLEPSSFSIGIAGAVVLIYAAVVVNNLRTMWIIS